MARATCVSLTCVSENFHPLFRLSHYTCATEHDTEPVRGAATRRRHIMEWVVFIAALVVLAALLMVQRRRRPAADEWLGALAWTESDAYDESRDDIAEAS
jgi:hypothetical protein